MTDAIGGQGGAAAAGVGGAPGGAFGPQDAVQLQAERGRQVGLVIDLTNTTRYYDPVEWDHLRVQHVKVPCVGRGAAPDPAAVSEIIPKLLSLLQRDETDRKPFGFLKVNQFFWIVHCFLAVPANARKFVLVHCTHGFNRTGFMICSYLMRTSRKVPELAMARAALERFRQARPPGVYKVSVTPLPFVHSRRGTRLRAEFHSRRGTD